MLFMALMKRYCILVSAAILSIFALSCSKNEIRDDSFGPEGGRKEEAGPGEVPEGYVRLVFGTDAELTRTTIAEGADGKREINWVAGDKVKVFYAGGSTSSQAAESGALTHFTVDVPQGTGQMYFSYPYETAASLNGSTLSLTIPSEQNGSFAGANYLVAAASASDENIHFYNAGALFKIVLEDAAITKATIEGNNGEALCGTVPFTFSGTGISPGTPSSTGTSITVNFNGAGTYYVTALPDISLSDGATLRFYRDDEPAGSAQWSGQVDIKRAQIASWGNSDAITCRFVRAGADAGKNGRSWEDAWGLDELKAFLTNSANLSRKQLELLDGITIKVAAGSYVFADSEVPNTQVDWFRSDNPMPLTVYFKGGYPATGGATADPAGNETVFSGGDKGCVLWVNQKSNISFDGFTFSHGKTAAGGQAALVFGNTGTASITNCKFRDNENSATAGALSLDGGGKFTVSNCEFSSNTAAHAAALNIDGASTTVMVSKCTFSQNVANGKNSESTAIGNGGALKVTNGTVTISDCVFTGNTANSHGGALWLSGGTTEVKDNTVFTGNSATWGGAMYSNGTSEGTFSSCTFGGSNEGDANTALPSSGGAVACDAGTIHFNSCTFAGNTAASDRGGAIFISEGVNASDPQSNIYISGGTFTGNKAVNGGAIAIQRGAELEVNDAEFASNNAKSHGGVICLTQGNPIVRLGKNNFHDNSANSVGGVIAAKGSGGASAPNTPEVYVNDGNNFTDNMAPNGGAAIRLRDEPAAVGSETKACLYISGKNTFTRNHSAAGYGGCLDLRTSGTVVIDGAVFNANYTENDATSAKGGAINLSDASLGTGDFTISNCVFEGNYAGNGTSHSSNSPNGGAINIGGNDSGWKMLTKIYNCLFKDNCAKQGGALYFQDAVAVTWISDCAFTGNHISNRYGTTIAIAKGTVCMNNCSFADNTYAIKEYSSNTLGQQCTWVNVKPAKFVMSNCSLIGTTRLDTGVLDNGSACLLRFDAIGNTHYLINNIIAPTGNCRTVWADNTPTINATSNKVGTKTFTAGATYNISGTESDGYLGTDNYFGALAWQGDYYWKWDGTLSGGSNTSMDTLENVKAAITAADSGFAAWLTSIGAIDKDCRGKTRGATTWPGAYDGTNE